MAKIRQSAALMLILVCAWYMDVCLGATIGPPKATLQKGQWRVGAEYFHEQMDLETSGLCEFRAPDGTLIDLDPNPAHASWKVTDLQTNVFFAGLSYGISDKWEAFVRLGMADAQDELVTGAAEETEYLIEDRYSINGQYGFSWALGTRRTFWRKGPWSMGGSAQLMSINPGTSTFTSAHPNPDDPNWTASGSIELDLWQTQFALGVTYAKDNICAYAGPFLQWVTGNLDLTITGDYEDEPAYRATCPHDIEDDWKVGGYTGIRWAVCKRAAWYAEGQFSGDSWGLGTGLVWRTK